MDNKNNLFWLLLVLVLFSTAAIIFNSGRGVVQKKISYTHDVLSIPEPDFDPTPENEIAIIADSITVGNDRINKLPFRFYAKEIGIYSGSVSCNVAPSEQIRMVVKGGGLINQSETGVFNIIIEPNTFKKLTKCVISVGSKTGPVASKGVTFIPE